MILRFQIVIAKWYGPESWAGGGFYTIGLNRGGRLKELIAVGSYKVISNMMVAHLTNADQGEMSRSSPWDLGPGCGHLKEDHRRGREYTIVYPMELSDVVSVLRIEFN